MRKALIGLILAATAMTPAAAWAQRDDNARAERIQHRNEARSERQAARSERQAVRAERQAPQVQAPRVDVQRSRAAEQQVVQRQRGSWGGRDRGDVGQRSSAYPSAWQGNPNDPARAHYEQLERRNQYRNGTREQREQVRQEVRQRDGRDGRGHWGDRDGRDGRGNWGDRNGRDGRGDWGRNDRGHNWDRNGWRNDRRYDWQRWRYSNRNLFHVRPYYSPYRNWGYSRFSIGVFLEPLFYSQRYWIGDPYQYRLPYAPPGTQWVRYYNDVLLVDVYSGEVVDVIYDFFW